MSFVLQVAALVLLLTRPEYAERARKIKALSLSGNGLTDQHAGTAALAAPDLTAHSFTCKHRIESNLSPRLFAEQLPWTHPTIAIRTGQQVQAMHAGMLLDGLQGLLSLERIDLSGNHLSPRTVGLLAEAVQDNRARCVCFRLSHASVFCYACVHLWNPRELSHSCRKDCSCHKPLVANMTVSLL